MAAHADLINESDVVRLYQESIAAHGPAQILIVNHGGHPAEDVPVTETVSLEKWKSTFDIDMASSFLVVRDYWEQLAQATEEQRERASVVLVGSTVGKYGERGHVDYAAAKSAMMYGFTMTLKNEIVQIAPRGQVNSVSPLGWALTQAVVPRFAQREVAYRALATYVNSCA